MRSQAVWSHYPVWHHFWGTTSPVKAWSLNICHSRRHDITAIVCTPPMKKCAKIWQIFLNSGKNLNLLLPLFCLSVCLVQYSNSVRRATSVPATTQRSLGPLAVLSPARIKASVIHPGWSPYLVPRGQASFSLLVMLCTTFWPADSKKYQKKFSSQSSLWYWIWLVSGINAAKLTV